MIDRIGQQLGNYRLVRLIGQGGFADVYLGKHIHLNTQAAIKVLQTRLVGSTLEQFRNEAQIIANLVHPHIVRVLDFGLQDNIPFLVMDFAPNGSLRQYHPRGISVPLEDILSYIRNIGSALQYAHDRKLIHRDIKPGNMLLTHNNDVLLSDFGLVSVAHSSGSQSTKEMAGTLAYMAPEQINGKPRPASDQYALGIVIYEWLSGDCPFRGSLVEIATQHLMTPPPPLCGKLSEVSPAIEEAVFTALRKDPHQRFENVREFAQALEQAILTRHSHSFVPPRAKKSRGLKQEVTASREDIPNPKTHRLPFSTDPNRDDVGQKKSFLSPTKLKHVPRRKALIGMGLGALTISGAIAAYEISQKVNFKSMTPNERQLQDAFNKGFTAGENAMRQEFITTMENLEGVSLDAAMAAAKLTRVAYDVFVSPLVKFLAGIAGDFLNVTLRALIQGRHWLSNIGQDNDTLAGLQHVLETWVQQHQEMPKQIQAVADADLDGAQAYLNALRRKLQAEKSKLN